MSSTSKRRKTEKSTVIVVTGDEGDLSINAFDYFWIHEMELRDREYKVPTRFITVEDKERRRVIALSLYRNAIPYFPPWLLLLNKLRELDLRFTNFEKLPDFRICDLPNLVKLELSDSKIKSLPTTIRWLKKLKLLDLADTQVEALPEEIGYLVCLVDLNLSGSSIKSLPSTIGQLKKLKSLALPYTEIEELPDEIGGLASLQTLNLHCNEDITSLPSSIGRLRNLERIDISHTGIKEIPDEIGDLPKLRSFHFGEETDQLSDSEDSEYEEYLESHSVRTVLSDKLLFRLSCVSVLSLRKDGWDPLRIIQRKPKLAPLALSQASRAFDMYRVCFCPSHDRVEYTIPKPQAVYFMIRENMERFVRIIIRARQSKRPATAKKGTKKIIQNIKKNGTIVRKRFNDGKYYEGEVIGYDKTNKYYKIEYTDGDQEEFDEKDMKKYYKKRQVYSKNNRRKKLKLK